jgi:hypothetical protein
VRALREPLQDVTPGTALPRAVGGHPTQVCGVAGMRVTTPYTLFMLQRVQDVHAALDDEARALAAGLLAETGWDELLAVRVPARVALDGYRLVRAAAV